MKIALDISSQVVVGSATSGPPPPVAIGNPPAQTFEAGTGVHTIDTSLFFSGAGVTYATDVAIGVEIDTISGILSFDTDLMPAQQDSIFSVSGINSGGFARVDLQITILAANQAPVITASNFVAPQLEIEATDPEGGPLLVFWGSFDDLATPSANDIRAGLGAYEVGSFSASEGQVTLRNVMLDKAATPAGPRQLGVVVEDEVGLLSGVSLTSFDVSYEPEAFEAAMWAAVPGNSQVGVTLSSLPDENGSTITDIEYSLDAGGWVSAGQTTDFTISGLTNDQEYQIRLRAVNAIGNSDASHAVAVTPVAGGLGYSAVTQFAPDLDSPEWGSFAIDGSGWHIDPAGRMRLDTIGGDFGGHTFNAGTHTIVCDLRRTAVGGSETIKFEINEIGGLGITGVVANPDSGQVSTAYGSVISSSGASVIDLGGGEYRIWFKASLVGGVRLILDANDHALDRNTDWRRPAIFEGDLSVSDITNLTYGS